MKWNRWNDQMVSLLIELYPVETTAHTAAMLEMSVSAVKYKAKELGLGKLAKSKWMERADHIRSHFNEESFTEIGEKLGVTRVTVSRIASKMGLKRSKHEGYKVSSRVRQKMVRRERRRMVFGLDPITRINVISNRAKVRLRYRLKVKGYILSGQKNLMYYTENPLPKTASGEPGHEIGNPFPTGSARGHYCNTQPHISTAMTYGQIISILFVALLCYYAFLIVMDIQRAKAAEAAEQDNHVEEDIDISDEAQSFRPHKVSREEPKKEDSHNENTLESSQQDDASPTQSDADTSQEGKEEAEDEQEETDNSEDVYNEIESGIATPSQATESDNQEEPSDVQPSEEDNSNEEQPEDDDQPFRSPTYREAILTDGILVDDIFKAIDQLAETGECDLGTIIYHCESMRYAG